MGVVAPLGVRAASGGQTLVGCSPALAVIDVRSHGAVDGTR